MNRDIEKYLPPVASEVVIRIRGCTPNSPLNLDIEIDPASAHIDEGAEFAWLIEGSPPARVQIRAKSGPWPFQQKEFPEVGAALNGTRVRAGRATQSAPGERAQYAIQVRCGNATVTIDPEIVIRNPDDFAR